MVSHAPSGLRGWIQVPLAQAAWGRSVASLACLLVMPVRITESTPGDPIGLASRRAGAGLEPTRGNPIGLAGRRLNRPLPHPPWQQARGETQSA